jgi:hypothetical protein
MNHVDVTERAKLWKGPLIGVAAVATVGCLAADTRTASVPQPVYDQQSRQLVRLDWDANGDGHIDQRTYFVGARAARTEVDSDRDARVDRWEYVNASAEVTHVGSSSANDGVEDTWTWPANAAGEVRIDRAQYRDRVIDRREFLRQDTLIRAEEDANRDGQVDKWETWEDGVLVMAAFDTTFATGRPDRRLRYEGGRFAYMETDVDGDGRFVRLASNQPGIRREDRDRH